MKLSDEVNFQVPASLNAPCLDLKYLENNAYYPVPKGYGVTSVVTDLGVFPQSDRAIRPGDIIMFYHWDTKDERFMRVKSDDLRVDGASMLLPTGLVIPEPRFKK